MLLASLFLGSGFLVVLSALPASATAVDYYNLRGFAGDDVIYLNTAITGTSPLSLIARSSTWGNQPAAFWNDQTDSVATIVAGTGDSTSSGRIQFQESFMGSGSNYLYVTMPVSAGGATRMVYINSIAPTMVGTMYLGVQNANAYASSADSPTGNYAVNVQLDHQADGGVNVTGASNSNPYSDWASVASLGLDVACVLIPGYDFICAPISIMLDLYGLPTGMSTPAASLTGNGNNFGEYIVKGGGNKVPDYQIGYYAGQDAYTADMLLDIRIPYDPIAGAFPFLPVFTLFTGGYLENPLCYYDNVCGIVTANASMSLRSYQAVLLTGTVTGLNGAILANQPVVLTTNMPFYSSPINYHLTTDAQGKYAFFAPLSNSFMVSTAVATPWGAVTESTPWFTTDSHPDQEIVNLQLPYIHGQVLSGSTGLGGATVVVTNPSGTTVSLTTDSAGNYAILAGALGTYGLVAHKYGYTQVSASQSVTLDAPYLQNFGLTPVTPGFTLSTCGSISVPANGNGACMVSLTSVGGWTGTVSLSVSVPSGLSDYVSPTSATPAPWGTSNSYVYITAGGTTGTYYITVTASSPGLSTVTRTFTVTVYTPSGGGTKCQIACPI